MTWEILDTGRRSGGFNMRLDEALAGTGPSPGTDGLLRLYGWSPPALSVGYHQPADGFDREALEGEGIDLVRRPTGGGAILHDAELTYSVVVELNGRGLRDIYRFVHQGLLCGIRLLGIDARLSGASGDLRDAHRSPSGAPCFASAAKDEIQAAGRKLVGSAQRRFGTRVLQHGSFLLGPQHRRIAGFLRERDAESRERVAGLLEAGSVDAESLLGRSVAYAEAASCIRRGFEEACGVSFVHRAVSETAGALEEYEA